MQQITIPEDTFKKFVELTTLLTQAGRVAREITTGITPTTAPTSAYLIKAQQMSNEFWQMTEELQQAFSNLSPSETEDLINEAVTAVRAKKNTNYHSPTMC